MVPAPFIVLLDANVLFPFSLRDTLLRAAAAGFYQVRWSSQILDEMARNLVSTGTMPEEKARRLRAIMEREFPEAAVTGDEHLVAAMRNHEKDRHVAAAAVKTGAQVITTANLRDFAELPEGIEAQSPDVFLCNLFDLDPDGLRRAPSRAGRGSRQPTDGLRRTAGTPGARRSRRGRRGSGAPRPHMIASRAIVLGSAQSRRPHCWRVAKTKRPFSAAAHCRSG
jgi:predicted nucleic acid-binding protein